MLDLLFRVLRPECRDNIELLVPIADPVAGDPANVFLKKSGTRGSTH